MSGDTRRYDYRRPNPYLRWGDTPDSVAPYVPTPVNVVRRMLDLAGVGPDDVVYDLGCGDGRILFMAVDEFGVKRAVGYDINPDMCEPLKAKIVGRGLEGRVDVVNANFFEVDLSPASVVTMYLTTSGNTKLRPKLEKELRRGSRVVSHDFPIHEWVTVKRENPQHYILGSHKIYLYLIPEAYEREITVPRTRDEENRWTRIKDLFQQENP